MSDLEGRVARVIGAARGNGRGIAESLIAAGATVFVEEIVATRIPIRHLGRPAEVADLVGRLASERSGFINGASIDINGGIIVI